MVMGASALPQGLIPCVFSPKIAHVVSIPFKLNTNMSF